MRSKVVRFRRYLEFPNLDINFIFLENLHLCVDIVFFPQAKGQFLT